MRFVVAVVAATALAMALPLPAVAGTCDLTVPQGGSVEAAVNKAVAGRTVCLRGGTHTAPDREFSFTARGVGTVGLADPQWVTVRSYPGELAVLYGRLVVEHGAAWIRFMNLSLDGSGGPLLNATTGETLPSPSISGHSISFLSDDITSRGTGVCLHERPPSYGEASYLRVRSSRIHDCGLYPPANKGHAIYLQVPGSRAQITDNWIYDSADRCVQVYPDADGAFIARNIIDGCGEGVMFGGSSENGPCAASDRNVVDGNVIANARVRWLVEAFWGCGAIGIGNVLRGNCLWPTNPVAFYRGNGGLDGTAGYRSEGNLVADPLYVNAPAKDFRLRPESPCLGKGPREVPGPRL